MPSLVIKDVKECWQLDDGREICTIEWQDKKTKKSGIGIISKLDMVMIENNRSINHLQSNDNKCDPEKEPFCLLKHLE